MLQLKEAIVDVDVDVDVVVDVLHWPHSVGAVVTPLFSRLLLGGSSGAAFFVVNPFVVNPFVVNPFVVDAMDALTVVNPGPAFFVDVVDAMDALAVVVPPGLVEDSVFNSTAVPS